MVSLSFHILGLLSFFISFCFICFVFVFACTSNIHTFSEITSVLAQVHIIESRYSLLGTSGGTTIVRCEFRNIREADYIQSLSAFEFLLLERVFKIKRLVVI